MRRDALARVLALSLAGTLLFAGAEVVESQEVLSPGFAAGGVGMSPEARAGRDIWFNATAFNDRFYTYSYPQRLGGAIDWYGILGAPFKRDLFQAWGAIPDPDCCVPGDPNCPAQSLDETYGFQWCPGDDELLKFVGKAGYRDPACNFLDSAFNASTPHGAMDQRQSACDLRFGTSTGALGFRKFPNPRFDKAKWEKLNGSLATWDGYRRSVSSTAGSPDSRVNRIFDGSIEPPFRIGMACGACHIAYDPLKPPADPNHPAWENIDGLVGNQFSRVSQILASGLAPTRLETQLISLARPGTVDTSALPMDTVANPGTMNAIINFAKRPLHEHTMTKWHKAASCEPGKPASECWCEPGRQNKCWSRFETTEKVPNILKGGEDTIGVPEAIQRVYFNIGSCAEQCWLNHIPDLRAIDPAQRNYGQTPFDIGQCRRDCPAFRAIEDRLDDLVAFFLQARPADLWRARGLDSQDALIAQLDQEFFPGAVTRGRDVFSDNCAECHSSVGEFSNFYATDPADPTLRVDWLSNENPVLASRVGTYPGRALHSNHMPSRVWEQYAAKTLWARAPDPERPEVLHGSGRGYYRPPSLLSVWAYAPLMHNNAIGPEVCGKPSDPALDFYDSTYVDANNKPVANPPACRPFDATVEGRYQLFKDSMAELLHPDQRIRKVQTTAEDIIVDVAPDITIGSLHTGFSIRVPKGTPTVRLNSLRYKDLLQDLLLNERDTATLDAKYKDILPPDRLAALKSGLSKLRKTMTGDVLSLDITAVQGDFIQGFYSNLLTIEENGGHRFGTDLPEEDKQALIAFLATL